MDRAFHQRLLFLRQVTPVGKALRIRLELRISDRPDMISNAVGDDERGFAVRLC